MLASNEVPAEELTGRTLGDFVVRHKIGEGGFGAVYRAEQRPLGREAVIKVLHTRHLASKTAIQRFLREAKLASRLDHPYAAHVYASNAEPDGLLWIAMEYVRGRSLYEILREKGPMSVDELVPLLDRICDVLAAAHDLGIVHRDIKPPNVMVVQRSGRLFPKLLDFGIAKLAIDEPPPEPEPRELRDPTPTAGTTGASPPGDGTVSFEGVVGGKLAALRAVRPSTQLAATYAADDTAQDAALTEVGATVGSPPYMAPEQWSDSSAATARSDLYALGVLVFEALSGQRPFAATSMAQLATDHHFAPIPRVSTLAPNVPPAVDDVIARALAKDPADRYGSALELAAAFRVAAGFAEQPLPALDEQLRASVEASLPQPIAEAVAAFHAARNPHQGRDALRELVATATRLVALFAIAGWAQQQPADPASTAALGDAIRELHRRALSDAEWLRLARAVAQPFRAQPKAFPIPELIALLAEDDGPLAEAVAAHSVETSAHGVVRELLPHAARLLRALAFLADYPLVVVDGGLAESWMGLRRARRIALELRSAKPLEPMMPIVVDGAGHPVLALWPLVQVSAPLPGAPNELFLLECRGRRGARLVARPLPLERQDEDAWVWLAERFAAHDRGHDTPSEERRPYRGLAAFTAEDAERFVGREREIDAALNRLRLAPLLAVVGPSGTGKSSFVHAGILPSLPDRRAIVVRPGPSPMAALESRLARDNASLDDTTVLVVDQLEELFTLGAPEDERRAFVRAILAAPHAIVTLRDDFLARATQMPELRERLPAALFVLGTPAPGDLRRILVEPLARLGYDFEDPATPERIVREVADAPGALALLSFFAAELWSLRDRNFRQLTRRAYESLGGVAGALARHAEATLAAMAPHEQTLARVALVNLVTADGTRAVLSRAELGQVLGGSTAVVDKLVAARLLVATETDTGDDRVEVVHEALIADWPRLAAWRREDLDGARLREQVRAAARPWDERRRPRGLLWRDDALAELKAWRARHPEPLPDVDEAFIAASLAEARRGRSIQRGIAIGAAVVAAIVVTVLFIATRTAQRERAEADSLRDKEKETLTASYLKQGREQFLAGDAPRSLAYFAEAMARGADTAALRYMLAAAERPLASQRAIMRGHTLPVRTVEWSPDGARLLSASEDGTARVWDASTGRELAAMRVPEGFGVYRAHFDATGERIVTSGSDGVARLYDRGGLMLRELAFTGSVNDVAFSPDGTRLAVAGVHGASLVEIAAGRTVALGTGVMNAVAFSPDGALVLAAGVDVTVYDAHTGAAVATLRGHDALVGTALFSRDGTRVVTAAGDQTARVWRDWAPGPPVAKVLHGDGGYVRMATFDPLGKLVVTVTAGGNAALWTVDGDPLFTLEQRGGTSVAAFDRAGRRVATGGSDGRVILWDVATGSPIATVQGHTHAIHAIEFSPDDRRLATASDDLTVRVWEPSTAPLRYMLPAGDDQYDARLSPDGALIAVADVQGARIRLLDARTGELARTLQGSSDLYPMQFCSATRLAAIEGGTVALWSVEGARVAAWTGKHPEHLACADRLVAFSDGSAISVWTGEGAPRQVAALDQPMALELSPNRELLAVGAASGVVNLVRLADARTVASANVDSHHIDELRFSPDGTLLAVAHEKGLATIAIATGELRPLSAKGLVRGVRFRPDGKQMLSINRDASVTLWSVANGSAERTLRANGNNMYTAEYDPTGRFIATGGDDRRLRLWDVESGEPIDALRGHAVAVYSAQFDPDGTSIVTLGLDRRIARWDLLTFDRRPSDAIVETVRCTTPWAVDAFANLVPSQPCRMK